MPQKFYRDYYHPSNARFWFYGDDSGALRTHLCMLPARVLLLARLSTCAAAEPVGNAACPAACVFATFRCGLCRWLQLRSGMLDANPPVLKAALSHAGMSC